MDYAIETFKLTKIFGDWWGRDKVLAVDGLDLQVRYNEIFGLLGPNGSGKTTVLKMLLGLLYPSRGRAVVLGGNGSDPKINSRIGFMPEESYLYRYLNARETLDFYGMLFGLPARVRRTRIEDLLEMVGLRAVANRPVGTYSKGMARRIGLAQALINDPELLILDEPTTGLDPIGTRQIKDLLVELAARGKTILLCSHLLADVEDVCGRIAILYGGRVQTAGQVKTLLRQSDKRQITTGQISDKALERIKGIVKAENSYCEVTTPMDKLESFFVKTVAEAQRQAKPTSGAVSTTRIGDFLMGRERAEGILDRLVSAPVEAGTPVQKRRDSEERAAKTPRRREGDRRLLEKLSRGPSRLKSPDVQRKKVEQAGKDSQEDRVRKDVLRDLTDGGGSTASKGDAGDGQGDRGA